MALIEITLDGKANKVDKAIQRIKAFEPLSNGLFDTPYYVAYSGGKDSDAIRILCELAGVKFDLVHNHTTVDAPETVRYVRGIVPKKNINSPKMSMWRLIENHTMPPTRIARYCCSALKEGGGKGRFVMTGVRWAESPKRKANRGGVEIVTSNIKNKLILNADNDESRQMVENCQMKGQRILNPIVDWTDSEIWELLNHYGCNSNPLYAEGWKRIGCVGCPLAGASKMKNDFVRWPKYKDNYIRAFQRMIDKHGLAETSKNFTSGQAAFDWWIDDKKQKVLNVSGQLDLFVDGVDTA